LDTVCRIAENQFAVITHFANIEHCTVGCYRRIHDGINLKAFKTTAGFVSVQAGTSVCAVANIAPLPTAQQVEKLAFRQLQFAYDTSSISVRRWHDIAQEIKEAAP